MEMLIVWIALKHLEQNLNLRFTKKICENHDYCYVQMPNE